MELLEIERELAGANRMEALARHDAVLERLGARLKDALRTGLPPEDFQRCSGLDDAVTTARKLLRLQVKDKRN